MVSALLQRPDSFLHVRDGQKPNRPLVRSSAARADRLVATRKRSGVCCGIGEHVRTFRTKAWSSFARPPCRMSLGPSQASPANFLVEQKPRITQSGGLPALPATLQIYLLRRERDIGAVVGSAGRVGIPGRCQQFIAFVKLRRNAGLAHSQSQHSSRAATTQICGLIWEASRMI